MSLLEYGDGGEDVGLLKLGVVHQYGCIYGVVTPNNVDPLLNTTVAIHSRKITIRAPERNEVC